MLSSLNNATQERLLSLAFVSAPRLKKEGDEVCGLRSPASNYSMFMSERSSSSIQSLTGGSLPAGAQRLLMEPTTGTTC